MAALAATAAADAAVVAAIHAVLTGPAFDEFVDREFATLRAIMVKSGMI